MKREIAKSRPESRPRPRQRRDFFVGFMFEPRNRRELSNFAQSWSRSRREYFYSVSDPARSLSRDRDNIMIFLKSQELCVSVEILGHLATRCEFFHLPSPLPPPTQCCQVAEIPAKKLKWGRRKKRWPKEFVAEFWLNFTKKWQKSGRRKFSTEVPYF